MQHKHKKIRKKKTEKGWQLFLDGEKLSVKDLLEKYPFMCRCKIRKLAGKKSNKPLLQYINDSIFKESRGVSNRAEVYTFADGRRFVVKDIAEKAGIGMSSAHARVKLWKDGKKTEAELVAPRGQSLVGISSHSGLLGLSNEPRPFNSKIPPPTPLERRVLGW